MATIVTRAGKGSPLTNNEVDANFENLNAEVTPLRHSIRPSLLLDFANSKTLDPRITFTRASTATYYDGKTVAKAEENLLKYSQVFENAAWTKTSSSITANTIVAPDGTTTADKLIEGASGSIAPIVSLRSLTVTSGVSYTGSFFAKAGELSWVRFGAGGSPFGDGTYFTDRSVYWDIGNGTVGTVGSTFDGASIENVGNGWYLCSFSGTAIITTSSFNFDIGLANADLGGTYTASGTSGIYIWGAQLEARDSVTAYTPTTTQPITNYIPVLQTAASGAARFDHDPVTGESKGLLIEEQRVNLKTYSEDFTNSSWIKFDSTVTSNTVIAPDGTLTGDSWIINAASTSYYVANFNLPNPVTISASTAYTASIYVKNNGLDKFGFSLNARTSGNTNITSTKINIDLSTETILSTVTGTFTNVTSSISHVGNGWYRISISGTTPATTALGVIGVFQANSPDTVTGDGYSGIYIWGAQLEAGAFPTSYIKTTSAQATRNEDEAEMSAAELAKVLNVSEGTAYIAANFSFSANTPRFIATIANGYNRYMGFMYLGGVAYFQPSNGSINSGKVISVGLNKQAISWSGASSPVCYNATNGTVGSADTGTGVNTFVTYEGLNVLRFGNSSQVFGEDQNGWVTKFALYPKALSTSELQALTEE